MHAPEDYVYLDWAATTPLCDEAAEAMAPFIAPGLANVAFGMNANSLHTPGRNAFTALENARASIARSVGAARPSEITFTSGATEADNAAIRGMIDARVKKERSRGNGGYTPHFVTSAIEHDAVLSLVAPLRAQGCEVTVLKPDSRGLIDAATLADAMRPETALVSIMWANNEIGTIQDIPALARVTHDAGAAFHTDATQAVGKVALSLKDAGVDAASFCAHKICGPKGVGALYLKAGTACEPFLVGGGQESGRRSGTQNVAGIMGFEAALAHAVANVDSERVRLSRLRDLAYGGCCAAGKARPTIADAPGDDAFLPNIASFVVPGFESETLILQLDIAGFAVSGSSACSTGSLEPSHVLSAIGVRRDDALCSLRVSIGRYTTEDDIDRFIDAFNVVVRA